MTVDFSAVKVGDRVRLTRDNGDEYTFEVDETEGTCISDMHGNDTYEVEWDNLEILKRRPAEGYYIYSSRVFYFTGGGEWADVTKNYAPDPTVQDYFDKGLLTRLVEETP